MKKKIIVSLLSILLYSCAEIGEITFVENKTNTNKKELKKIMLIGAGSTDTRFFLDMLNLELNKGFKKREIKTDYFYTGKISEDSSINVTSLLNKPYDAFIVFKPIDKSKVYFNSSHHENDINVDALGPNPIRISYNDKKNSILFKQVFEIAIYIPKDGLNKIWEATLKLTIDFTRQKNYVEIAKKILNSLQQNYLITKLY